MVDGIARRGLRGIFGVEIWVMGDKSRFTNDLGDRYLLFVFLLGEPLIVQATVGAHIATRKNERYNNRPTTSRKHLPTLNFRHFRQSFPAQPFAEPPLQP